MSLSETQIKEVIFSLTCYDINTLFPENFDIEKETLLPIKYKYENESDREEKILNNLLEICSIASVFIQNNESQR